MKSYRLKYSSNITYGNYFSKKEMKRAEYNYSVCEKISKMLSIDDMLYCHTDIIGPRMDGVIWNYSGKCYKILGFYRPSRTTTTTPGSPSVKILH